MIVVFCNPLAVFCKKLIGIIPTTVSPVSELL